MLNQKQHRQKNNNDEIEVGTFEKNETNRSLRLNNIPKQNENCQKRNEYISRLSLTPQKANACL